MAQNETLRKQFQKIRTKYPQKLTIIQAKQSLLHQCIQKLYLSEFIKIFQHNNPSDRRKNENKQKVIDETSKNNIISEEVMDKYILEAINIIVKAYQQHTDINEVYNFQHITQIIQKTKITLKDIIQNQNPSKLNMKQSSSLKISDNKTPKQTVNQLQKINNASQNTNGQKQIITKPQIKQMAVKPKINSLFVQKQAPISQKNIFKGLKNESRPSSRLLNQKVQNMTIPEKPISRSSAKSNKSNRSRRSKVSSKGPQDIPVPVQIEEKNEILQQHENKLEDTNYEQIKENNVKIDNQKVQKEQIYQKPLSVKSEEKQLSQQQNQQIIHDEIKQQSVQVNNNTKRKKFYHQNNSFHLPTFQLSTERPIRKKNPIESILTNPYIKKTFAHLCKQSYVGGGKTFDQIAKSADIMTLNKWMVFCKQFDFLSKLKKKQLIDIFQHTTQNKPHMNQKQFLDALIIVQNKLKVDEQDFIRKNMCLDSDIAFRQKVANFKVNYAGPRVNFFQQATLKPIDKYYQNLRQMKYQQQKQKKKQMILLQGKFQQQMESQLLNRKKVRDLKKSNMMSSSLAQRSVNKSKVIISTSMDKRMGEKQVVKSPYLNYIENKIKSNGNNRYDLTSSKLQISRRIDPLTYSELFSQKNSITTRAFTNDKKDSVDKSIQKKIKQISNFLPYFQRPVTQFSKASLQMKIQNPHLKISQKKTLKIIQRKTDKAQRPNRQWVPQIKTENDQLQRHDSEESDEILREHLMEQKFRKTGLPKKMQLSKIVQQYTKDEKWLQLNDQEGNNSEWDRETQFQATQNKQRFK